jgi:PAS domain S-box-containing protein
MSPTGSDGISYRQIAGIALGLVLVAGAAFVALLVAFESVESERGRDIQLNYGELQLSTVRAAALDAERLPRANDAETRDRLATRIEAAADSIETVQRAVLSDSAAGVVLGQATAAYVSALRALADAAPGATGEDETLATILAAATGALRVDLEGLAARLRLERDLARERGQRLRMALLIVVIVVVGAGLIFMYRRRLHHGAVVRDLVPADDSTVANPLTQAIESMSEGVALYDSTDGLVLCNNQYREQFAEAGVELVPGMSFETILREAVGRGLVADLGDDPEAWIAMRLAHHGGPRGPIRVYLADGRCLQIGEYQTGDGGIVSIQTDITEMERREAARQAREEIARSIVDSVFDGIVTFDSDFQLETLNPAAEEMFGVGADEVRGESFLRLIAESFHDEYRQVLGQTFETGRSPLLEGIRQIEGRRADGRTFPLEIALGELRGTGTLLERRRTQRRVFIATTRDISTQTKLARQIPQVQKMEAIGTLAGGIAHDFNNILSIILGYASLALDRARLPDDRENLEMVVQAGRRARDLIDQILTFSRRSEHEKVPADLSLVVSEVLQLIRSTLPSTIEIHQKIGADAAPVLADASQIHQVVMNLCVNASQAMEAKGGLLEVSLGRMVVDEEAARRYGNIRPGVYHRLAIRDTGHGIERAVLERIFEPFFTTKDVGKGTGLGLAVAHGIISDHGGTITVDSAPGAGTSFAILLPEHEGPLPMASERGGREAMKHGPAHIMFVDDEAALVRMADKVLTGLGYKVTGETESVAALARFRGDPHAYDLVVTDQTMPGLTGDALVRELRRCREDIPVIVCTGLGHHFTAAMADELGLTGHIRKPLLPDELGRVVSQALKR